MFDRVVNTPLSFDNVRNIVVIAMEFVQFSTEKETVLSHKVIMGFLSALMLGKIFVR